MDGKVWMGMTSLLKSFFWVAFGKTSMFECGGGQQQEQQQQQMQQRIARFR